ncbi:hypothetical protein RSA31_22130 [Pantoea dispersa]|nr:hypothetical protein RSA31_22130 [Pantoea dispersa]
MPAARWPAPGPDARGRPRAGPRDARPSCAAGTAAYPGRARRAPRRGRRRAARSRTAPDAGCSRTSSDRSHPGCCRPAPCGRHG